MVNGPRCEGCALQKVGSGFASVEVGARYPANRLLLVGEASGEAEARDSLPFRPYAQSGSLLADALREVGMSRADVAITNVLRCRPPKDWLEGAPWQFPAITQCTREYLDDVIRDLKPRAILALGGTAMRVLTETGRGKAFALEYIRGFARFGAGIAEGIPVISTFHPAFIRRGSPHLTPLLQRDLRRAFAIATGKFQDGREYALDPFALGLRYQTAPTLAEARAWAAAMDPTRPLTFDIETPYSTRNDEDERTSFTDRDIKLVQFCQDRGTGIALPFRDEYREVIGDVLKRAEVKIGYNNWAFDDQVLKANGIDVGDTHDAMVMYHVMQPDLPANLQTAAQFCGFPFAWKHYAGDDLEWYGVADVDATLCVFTVMKEWMEREGMWEAYARYFHDFHRVTARMSDRGLPISETKRLALKKVIEEEDGRATGAIQALVPEEALGGKQKAGLKRAPKDTEGYVLREVVVEKEEKCAACVKKTRAVCEVCVGTGVIPAGTVVERWMKLVEFNPNSSHQVKAFMKYLKHPLPKHAKRTDLITGEAATTTEVKELERLYVKTKHPIYPLLIEKRQLSKIDGTYAEGWKPWADGRIHTTFTFKPATMQTSSRSPNIQNGLKHGKTAFQKRLAKAFNGMQQAEPGHLMLNVDAKSFHAQTTACEAGLPHYLRLAKIDIHSFVTFHYLKMPKRDYLLELPDEELKAVFAEAKRDPKFKETRDVKAKRTILGIQFAMFHRKLYQLNPDDFESPKEAQALWELIMVHLFPGLAVWQKAVRAEAQERGFLQCRFGALRRFSDVQRWDRKQQKMVSGEQAEAAVAFRPAANAFGMMREVMIRCEEKGWNERYQLVNSIHDSLVFHCPKELVEECLVNVTREVSIPCGKMVYPGVTDERGLSVETEAAFGENAAEMEVWKG